ncbi:hypothetical protein [Primorskyibacter sp. S187A]|uniref:hypothetical protein n=1 Tax=Primorskyibacter sp. S187A TaxID=3415130 RepID=UPI003C7DFC75
MTLQHIGGLAALICAGTYIFGFAALVTFLAGLGYGTGEIDAAAVVGFTAENPAVLLLWNTAIYIVNALALAVLVVALAGRVRRLSEDWANTSLAFGLIWATLVLAAGMLANVTTERVAALSPRDLDAAIRSWEVLHAVELGLGGGNEIAGGAWILCLSLAGLRHRIFGSAVLGLGLLTGLGGVLTLLPPLGDVAGVVFGLGAIGWFVAVGLSLCLGRDGAGGPPQSQPADQGGKTP